jgi:hypothetical protein
MTKLAIAALTGLALLMPQAVSSSYAAGATAAKTEFSASRKKPKYSRAHCMKLNPEKARMYGICREYLR